MNSSPPLKLVPPFAALHGAPTRVTLSRELLSASLTSLAALAVTHLAIWLAIGALGIAVGLPSSTITPILALVIAVAVIGACSDHTQGSVPSTTVVAVLGLGLVWGAALLYAHLLDDLSVDGQGYHALAVLEFRQGWNPFRSLLTPDVAHQLWLNHYPKGPWIWAASIDAMFGSLQAAKATNVVLAMAAGAAVACVASTVLQAPLWRSLVFGALAAANPVASVQFPTMYVDGQLASLLTIMAAGAIVWIVRRSRLALLMACSAAICLVNIKFTGAVYAGLFASAIAVIGLLRGRRLLGFMPLVACMLAFVGPGYTPYITNLLQGHHVLYPLMGEGRVDIMARMSPTALEGHSAIAKLAFSLGAETANACQNCEAAQLKIPFTVRLAEARGAMIPDPRTGGFGPLFSAALLLAATLLILAARARATSATLVASLAFLIGSVLINPEAWWARYAPQLWLVPLTVVMFLDAAKLSRAARAVTVALLIVLIADAVFMATIASGYAAYRTHKARAQIEALSHVGPVYVREPRYFGWSGTLQRLRDGGVTYEQRDFSESDCKAIDAVVGSELEVCVPKARGAAEPR
jgi:hypothetical protein